MTNNNKKCSYCDKDILDSNKLDEEVIVFCDAGCYGNQWMEDE